MQLISLQFSGCYLSLYNYALLISRHNEKLTFAILCRFSKIYCSLMFETWSSVTPFFDCRCWQWGRITFLIVFFGQVHAGHYSFSPCSAWSWRFIGAFHTSENPSQSYYRTASYQWLSGQRNWGQCSEWCHLNQFTGGEYSIWFFDLMNICHRSPKIIFGSLWLNRGCTP